MNGVGNNSVNKLFEQDMHKLARRIEIEMGMQPSLNILLAVCVLLLGIEATTFAVVTTALGPLSPAPILSRCLRTVAASSQARRAPWAWVNSSIRRKSNLKWRILK